MKKNLVAASAVVLGLALSGAALAGGPVADTGFNHTGLYTGVVTESKAMNLSTYDFNIGFATNTYSVGTLLSGDYDKDLGLALYLDPYFMMQKALAPRWTFEYGLCGETIIFSDKAKYGADQVPFSVAASIELSYAWGKHTELFIGTDPFSFVRSQYKAVDDKYVLFDGFAGGINYYFS